MIKKQQKWIALLVALTFMWLLQVSTMPLAAAAAPEQIRSASAGPGPDYYEAISQKAAPAKKKSILPYVLIGVGLVAVTAVLFLVVLKPKYDITGTWNLVLTDGADTESITFIFTGTKESGYWSLPGSPILGTYSVDKKNVTLVITAAPAIQIKGQFTKKDTMTGTWVDGSNSLTWTATRIAAAASVNPAPAALSRLFPK
jgi:hypothetical protein